MIDEGVVTLARKGGKTNADTIRELGQSIAKETLARMAGEIDRNPARLSRTDIAGVSGEIVPGEPLPGGQSIPTRSAWRSSWADFLDNCLLEEQTGKHLQHNFVENCLLEEVQTGKHLQHNSPENCLLEEQMGKHLQQSAGVVRESFSKDLVGGLMSTVIQTMLQYAVTQDMVDTVMDLTAKFWASLSGFVEMSEAEQMRTRE